MEKPSRIVSFNGCLWCPDVSHLNVKMFKGCHLSLVVVYGLHQLSFSPVNVPTDSIC